MEIINSPHDPLTKDSLETFIEKVRKNMVEIYTLLLSGSSIISRATVNLSAGASETTIAGTSFSNPITKLPTMMVAVYDNGSGTVIDVSNIIDRAVLNGSVYDIIITPLEDSYNNVTISVI